MTLVVVRKAHGAIMAVADTRLDPVAKAPWRFLDQANKLVCLNSGWCVGYSGNVSYAETVIPELMRMEDIGFSDLQPRLLNVNRESVEHDDEAEFLLFSTVSAAIHKFSNGKHTRTEHAAHIGEETAFSRFQEVMNNPGGVHLHPLCSPDKDGPIRMRISASHVKIEEQDDSAEKRLAQMSRAMFAVIGIPRLPSLGVFKCLSS